MQNRKDDVDRARQIGRPAGLRKDRELSGAAWHEGDARSAFRNGRGKRTVFNGAEQPGAGPGDANRDRVVARRVERAEHIARGHDRHVVLGRAAAEQQPDAQSFVHVAVSRIDPLAGTSPKGTGLVNRRWRGVGAEPRARRRLAAIGGIQAERVRCKGSARRRPRDRRHHGPARGVPIRPC